MGALEREGEGGEVCTGYSPLDVETRWSEGYYYTNTVSAGHSLHVWLVTRFSDSEWDMSAETEDDLNQRHDKHGHSEASENVLVRSTMS